MNQSNTGYSTSRQVGSEKDGEEAKSNDQDTIFSCDLTNDPIKLYGLLNNAEAIARFERWPQHPPEKDTNSATTKTKKFSTSNNVLFTNRDCEVNFQFLSPEALKRFNQRPQHPPEKIKNKQ